MRNGYFGVWIGIAIVAGIVVSFNLLGGLLIVAIYGMDVKKADPTGLLIINSLSQLAIMLGAPILILRGMKQNVWETLKLDTRNFRSSPLLFVLAATITFAGQIFGTALSSLWSSFLSLFPDLYSGLRSLQDMMDDTMKLVTESHTPAGLLVGLFTIALVPAICEEVFFRGFIQTNIDRSGVRGSRPAVAITVTSLCFAAMHLSPFNLPGLAVLGALFGWMIHRTRDLRISMFAHLFNNGLILILLYVFHENKEIQKSLNDSNAIPLGDALAMTLTTGVILAGLLYLFHRSVNSISPTNDTIE